MKVFNLDIKSSHDIMPYNCKSNISKTNTCIKICLKEFMTHNRKANHGWALQVEPSLDHETIASALRRIGHQRRNWTPQAREGVKTALLAKLKPYPIPKTSNTNQKVTPTQTLTT